jgi:hypothetical protein
MAAQMVDTSAEHAQSTSPSKVLPVGTSLDAGSCRRCGGLMVADRYIDLLDDTGKIEFVANRCIQCGDVVDQTILRNRRASQAHTVTAPLAQVA